MSFTVFLGNLPVWVTADDIRSWLAPENLVADSIKVIRNPETQESKGFAFIDAPNSEEMNSIIRRFDRAPLEDRLLRANPAQPPKARASAPPPAVYSRPAAASPVAVANVSVASPVIAAANGEVAKAPTNGAAMRPERGGRKHKRPRSSPSDGPHSAFAEELAKAL